MFKDLSIRLKILLGFGIIFSLFALAGTVSIFSVRKISTNSEFIKDVAFTEALLLIEIESTVKQMASLITTAVDTGTNTEFVKAEKIKRDLDVKMAKAYKYFSNENIHRATFRRMEAALEEYFEAGDDLFSKTTNQEWTEIAHAFKLFSQAEKEIFESIAALKKHGVKQLDNSISKISDLTKRTATSISTIMAITLFFVILLVYYIGYQLVQPVRKLIGIMKEAEGGDFGVRADTDRKDEMGSLANGFNEMLQHIQAREKELELHRNHLEELVKQRTTELSESEEHLQNLLDSVHAGIMVIDAETHKITDVNLFGAEMIGSPRDEIIGRTCHKFVCIAERGKCPITDLGQEIDNTERILLKADGSQLPILKSVVPMTYRGRSILIESFVDLTKLQEAEEALKQSSDFIKTTLDSLHDSISIIDVSNCKIIGANKSFLEEVGRTEEEVLGETCYGITHAREDMCTPPHDPCPLMDTLKTGQHVIKEHVHYKDHNRAHEVEVSTSPIYDEDGKIIQVVHVSRDITESKKAERALEAFNEKLKRSNQELQDFAYVASHDLQEPLRKVQVFGDRLKVKFVEELGEQGRDYLERMQNASGRMQTLINDLLKFSRVTTKAQPFTQVNLAQIAQEVVSDLEVRIDETAGKVEIDNLPTIDADPLQMRQLFQNLIGNALKFHQEGVPPVVKVYSNSFSDPSGGTCEITVEDNGIGFDGKYIDRIFGVFQRLHGRDEYEGTGVGLAVCRKIIERHGGIISAKSKPGKITKFIVSLPIKQKKEENSE